MPENPLFVIYYWLLESKQSKGLGVYLETTEMFKGKFDGW